MVILKVTKIQGFIAVLENTLYKKTYGGDSTEISNLNFVSMPSCLHKIASSSV